ncbi:MAG: hypothetical protein HGB21_03980 [Nitrospirae bacterium]|nr:hypothetical protein [Nitrospirota bacterium]NTW65463.1 hypothetical protein [Nitrospirota bacterium]
MFSLRKIRDDFLCPENQPVVFTGQYFDVEKDKTVRRYKGTACITCQSQSKYTKRKGGIRHLKMYPHEAAQNIMIAKMKTQEAKELYKLRQ